MKVLVSGEAVRQQATMLAATGGEGCSLAWLDAGGAPTLTAGATATAVVETRGPAGHRITHVRFQRRLN